MKQLFIVTGIITTTLGAALQSEAAAEEVKVAVRLESQASSTYVVRGNPQYLTKTDPSLQWLAAIQAEHLGPGTAFLIGAGVSALQDFGLQGGAQLEIVFGGGYALPLFGGLSTSVGYAAHFLPEADRLDAAHELVFGLEEETELVSLKSEVAVEFVHHGAYAMIGASHAFSFGRLTLTPSLSAGIAGYREQPMGFNDLTAGLSAKVDLFSAIYAVGSANYAYRGAPELEDFQARSMPWFTLGAGIQL